MKDDDMTTFHVEPTEDGLFVAYHANDHHNCAFGETPEEALDNLREKTSDYTTSLNTSDYDDIWA